ncbi:MAG: MHYT domain-containing protein, partial [Acinetobacter sp.]
HIHYDFSLIVGSIIVAILICYLAISIEQLLFRELFKKYKKTLLVISGFVLGAAIWCTHLVGILASHLPADYSSDYRFVFVSYIIAFIASTFAVWLITKETLPFMRLILGALLMGLGISGMHYVGMMGLVLDQHKMYYDPLLTLFSVLIAISGSGLTLWLTFKYKNAVYKL